jgi:ParB-like chromosome segregation protein Spo0J
MSVYFHPDSEKHLVDISTVRPDPTNENSGDVDAVVESIVSNGFYGAVITDQDGMLIAGHTRYDALHSLGAEQIPVLKVHVTDDYQRARIRVGDNRTTRLGRDDPALMLKTLESLLETDMGLMGTGYQDGDLDILRASLEGPLEFNEEEFAKQRSGHVCACPRCGWSSDGSK